MSFEIIDIEYWKRKEYFEHYFSGVPCTYSFTVKIDITKIKNSDQKLYPTMLYYLTKIVNRHEEFRMSLDEEGKLGVFDKMSPCYTIFHKDSETFSNVWTEYCEDWEIFYEAYQQDIEKYGSVKRMNAKDNIPLNTFPVSMIPWESFEGFNLNLQKGYEYLLPIFTMGKYYEENGKYMLPLAIQVHHAVCDGFHVCRFVNELRDLVGR